MNKNPIDKILQQYQIMILDGALATELERRNINMNDELWSAKVLAENPLVIEQVHYDYFKAGADCGISSSDQATVEGFMKRGYSKKQAEDMIRLSDDPRGY